MSKIVTDDELGRKLARLPVTWQFVLAMSWLDRGIAIFRKECGTDDGIEHLDACCQEFWNIFPPESDDFTSQLSFYEEDPEQGPSPICEAPPNTAFFGQSLCYLAQHVETNSEKIRTDKGNRDTLDLLESFNAYVIGVESLLFGLGVVPHIDAQKHPVGQHELRGYIAIAKALINREETQQRPETRDEFWKVVPPFTLPTKQSG